MIGEVLHCIAWGCTCRGSGARERIQVGRLTRTTKPPRQVYAKLGGDTCGFQRVCLLHRGKKWKTDLQDTIYSHCKR